MIKTILTKEMEEFFLDPETTPEEALQVLKCIIELTHSYKSLENIVTPLPKDLQRLAKSFNSQIEVLQMAYERKLESRRKWWNKHHQSQKVENDEDDFQI